MNNGPKDCITNQKKSMMMKKWIVDIKKNEAPYISEGALVISHWHGHITPAIPATTASYLGIPYL